MYKQILKDLESLLETSPRAGLEEGIVHIIKKYEKIDLATPLMITTTQGRVITCQDHWQSKRNSVIFVENEEDIQKLFEALVEQDDYWQDEKHLIQVIPEIVKYVESCTQYAGKLDIYDVPKLRQEMLLKGIKFLIYQEPEDLNY